MKIRFIDSVAGARFAYRMHQVVELPDDVARGFISDRQAGPHEEPIETATAMAPETAARRVGGRRRGLRNLGGLLR